MRWLLDLCFKTKFAPIPGSENEPDGVTVVIVTDPPIGAVVRVYYDAHLVKMRFHPHGEVSPRSTRRRNAARTPEPLPELNTLPGFNNLSYDEQFAMQDRWDQHVTFDLKPNKKSATYYRCSSMDSIYKGQNVFLYLPPQDKTELLQRKTLDGRTLPLEPTMYKDDNEAMYLPLLLDLREKGGDPLNDLSVALIGKGPAGMSEARAIMSVYREDSRYLPYLKGTLKQVPWASEIREAACNKLWSAGRRYGVKDLPDGTDVRAERDDSYVINKENIAGLLEELNLADEAKGWIDNRNAPFRWLLDRVEARAALGELGKYKPPGPLVIPPLPPLPEEDP